MSAAKGEPVLGVLVRSPGCLRHAVERGEQVYVNESHAVLHSGWPPSCKRLDYDKAATLSTADQRVTADRLNRSRQRTFRRMDRFLTGPGIFRNGALHGRSSGLLPQCVHERTITHAMSDVEPSCLCHTR